VLVRAPMPDFTLTMATPQEDSLADEEARLTRSEFRAEALVATGLLAAIVALFLLDPHARDGDPLLFGLCVALLALSHAARIDLPLAWTAPVQLALVPTLFLLPGWLVPLTMTSAVAIARIPDVIRGRTAPARLLLSPGNSWFTVGPAAVLLAAGSPTPEQAGVALLAVMLVAQVATDFASSSLFHLLTRQVSLREQIGESAWVYTIDAALAPVGLLAALSIDESPWYLTLMIPMFGVLAVFAGERRTRLRQLTELNGAYRGTALVLADVVDADDAYTGMHTRDVVELALAVADRLGLDADRRRAVEFGALLHDVGKVSIPKEIINKPGPLDDAEWDVMRRHTIVGQAMLDRVGGDMREVGLVVRASHERFDGGGYPDGLA
jgi:putative nucleotidyltransferase with HDIG domain